MKTVIDNQEIIYDKSIDFIMLSKCYENGNNCYNCLERVVDGCIIDEVDTDGLEEQV